MRDISNDTHRLKLSPAEAERIINALNEKDKDPERGCEHCGNKTTQLYPTTIAFSAPILHDDGSHSPNLKSGQSLSIATVCPDCGNTKFYNLQALGVKLDGSNDE